MFDSNAFILIKITKYVWIFRIQTLFSLSWKKKFQLKNMKKIIAEKQQNQINVRIVRVENWIFDELSIDEKNENDNDFDIDIFFNIMIKSVRTKNHKFEKFWKKMKKLQSNQKYAVFKTIQFENWMNNTKNFSATFVSIKKTYTLTNVNKNEFTDFILRNAYSSTDNKIFKKNVIMMNVSTKKKSSISQSKTTQKNNKNKFIYIFKFINSVIISIFEKIL